ncbi:MAG TPA: hypothetical protein PLP07_01955 [Pyrinomonadaceae bacterium]|nr:hypothetical protein [Chloracidobacterium sp.]MBP9935736.1 hypothetical protein [Pyrinomonadaceae bacterium]MBK7801809.1 hypothetical protein [Chloracidobacterium sp.]MBK9438043.1 hypothetical protein [Chloracidobacterium sp.]MBK9765514.1 hypothetical protein [Chloracidobacterium sp.]
MKKVLLTLLISLVAAHLVAAQNKPDRKADRDGVKAEIADAKKQMQDPINALLTVAGVGEPDSFGKNVLFLGSASTGTVYSYFSCDPAVLLSDHGITLGPDDRCFTHTVGTTTSSATFEDIGRITIPGRSAENVIYFILNNTMTSEVENTYSNVLPTFVRYTPTLRIESDALNDPTAVDPTTGAPLNGVLTVSAFGTKIANKSVVAGEFDFGYDAYSSAATRGFARSYFADLGLPQPVINRLYRKPMTIKLGMKVSVRNIALAQFAYTMRLTGN